MSTCSYRSALDADEVADGLVNGMVLVQIARVRAGREVVVRTTNDVGSLEMPGIVVPVVPGASVRVSDGEGPSEVLVLAGC